MDSAREAGQPSDAGPVHLTPADLAGAYPASFYAEDFAATGRLLAEGFFFDGPFAQVQGREPVLDSAARLKPVVRGHRLLRQRADGEHVSCWLDVSLQKPVKALRLRRGPGAGAASGRWPDWGCGRRA